MGVAEERGVGMQNGGECLEMGVAEERGKMAKLVSSWLGLITPTGAPPESVVESAETFEEGGSHLRMELAVAAFTISCKLTNQYPCFNIF